MRHDESAVGATGILTVAIGDSDHLGEVLIRIRGGTETYLAASDEPLDKGAAVLVVEAIGPRTVTVVAWPWQPFDPP